MHRCQFPDRIVVPLHMLNCESCSAHLAYWILSYDPMRSCQLSIKCRRTASGADPFSCSRKQMRLRVQTRAKSLATNNLFQRLCFRTDHGRTAGPFVPSPWQREAIACWASISLTRRVCLICRHVYTRVNSRVCN